MRWRKDDHAYVIYGVGRHRRGDDGDLATQVLPQAVRQPDQVIRIQYSDQINR
jgi:hypothetical protein